MSSDSCVPVRVLPEAGSPAYARLCDGHYIVSGACNAGAILRTIVRRMDEDPTLRYQALSKDPGVRLMLFQVLHLMSTDCEGKSLEDTFSEDYEIACKANEDDIARRKGDADNRQTS